MKTKLAGLSILGLLAISCSQASSPAPAQGSPANSEPTAPASLTKPPAEATTTASGLAVLITRHGQGTTHPGPKSSVEVHYSGWTTDGNMFDSSLTRGTPLTAGVDQVIAGFGEGMQLMVEGDKAILWIPEALAYKGQQGAPQGMLVFEVELLRIVQP